MKKNTQKLTLIVPFFAAGLLLALAFVPFAFAQGQGSGGSANGSQVGAQQDRLQDGTGDNCVDEDCDGTPDQDRDRLQDGTGDSCDGDADCDGTPDQDRLQTQDQDRLQDGTGDNCVDNDCDGTPDQDRLRVQDRLNTSDGIQQFVQERSQARASEQAGQGAQVQSRVEAQVAADTIEAAAPMFGQNAPRMSEVAREMNQAMNDLATREEALQNRSRIQLFLFGQDDEVVATMQQEMQQNQDRIQEMKQLMVDCEDCSQGTTEALVAQIQNMEREQSRLQEVVDDAADRRGVFGFLFVWLR